MKSILTIRNLSIYFFTFLFIQTSFAQNENEKWVFGVGLNAVDFFPFDTEGNGNTEGFLNEVANAVDHWNFGGPKLHATRHLVSGLSLEGAFTYNKLKQFGDVRTERENYFAFDVNAQYFLLNPEKDFNIALSLGGGYAFGYHSGGTVNMGGNMSWWFTENVGFNLQGLVKYNSPDFSLEPHMYYAFGLVFKQGKKEKDQIENVKE